MAATQACLSGRYPALCRGRVSATSRPLLGWLAFDCSCSAAAQPSPLAVSQPYLGSDDVSRPSISATSVWLLSGSLSGPWLFGSLYVASRPIVHRYAVRPPLGRHSAGCPPLSRPCLAAIPRLALADCLLFGCWPVIFVWRLADHLADQA